ncbi:MAG: response regulator [Planctomycetaceae bacterium]|nr:response regulator [Planctomycetaceae bacterium]
MAVTLVGTVASQAVCAAVEWNRLESLPPVATLAAVICTAAVFIAVSFFKPLSLSYRAAIITIYPYLVITAVMYFIDADNWICCALVACATISIIAQNRWLVFEAYIFGIAVFAVTLICNQYDEKFKNVIDFFYFDVYIYHFAVVVAYLLTVWINQQNKRLQVQTEFAESAARSRSDFIANINHEIRTPLNAILGFCSFLHRSKLQPTEQEYIAGIRSASQSLIAIVNNILDLAKVESGKFEIIPVQYDVMSFCNDLVNTLMDRFTDKPVRFLIEIDPALPQVLVGDELRIRQVVTNFVSNAAKFTKRGFVRLSFSGVVSNDRLLLHVSVQDTGSGVKYSDLPKLFSTFQQIDTKRNRKTEGSGLGLVICKNFINLMNGTVYVNTAWGEGSTFSFVVPQEFGTIREPIIPRSEISQYYVAVLESDPYFLEQWERLFSGLKINYKLSSSPIDFFALIHSHLFTHYFITEEIYSKMSKELSVMDVNIILIIRYNTRVDVSFSVPYIRRPIHSRKLWDVLLGGGTVGAVSGLKARSFIAPEAEILVVDDNAINLKIAEGLLKPYECRVTCVASGEQAIEMIKHHFYDLVMMDHMMPDMDGVETVGIIRSIEGEYFRTVPIISVTANVMSGVQDMFLAAGFNSFVPKPIEPAVLEKMLLEFVPNKKILYGENTARNAAEEPAVDSDYEVLSSIIKNGGKLQEKGADNKEAESAPPVNLLDSALGLKYTGGSSEIYTSLLQDFTAAAPNTLQKIRTLFETKDWSNFTIEVHAVKSISKTFGAMPLHKLSLELERAGKEGNERLISEKIEEYLTLYAETVVRIHQYLEHTP